MYVAYHITLLRLDPCGISVDMERWLLEHSLSYLRMGLSAQLAQNVAGPG